MTTTTTATTVPDRRRYAVYPAATALGDRIVPAFLLRLTDDLHEARSVAALAYRNYAHGGVVADRATGLLDAGFGWGVPAPDVWEKHARDVEGWIDSDG